MKKAVLIYLTVLIMFGLNSIALAQAYSIYEIQYTTDPDGESPLAGQVVDCLGGIVTHKYPGTKPKLTIQNPDFPFGWGAIQIKDWLSGEPLYNKSSVGDWITLTNVLIQEYSGGGTILQCYSSNDANLTVISSNNLLPEPLLIDVNEIAAPLYQETPDGWFVQDRNAEKYEAMLVSVRDVTVTEIDNGKARDNYTLQSNEFPDDPNFSYWASDYMNEDNDYGQDYHSSVDTGKHFCCVTGIIEHYNGYSDGLQWDYYQLLTTKNEDFLVDQPADFDDDCDVDFSDYSYFAKYWLTDCYSDANCIKADMVENGIVESNDLEELVYHWLDGTN